MMKMQMEMRMRMRMIFTVKTGNHCWFNTHQTSLARGCFRMCRFSSPGFKAPSNLPGALLCQQLTRTETYLG
jgi:hypothetical protein